MEAFQLWVRRDPGYELRVSMKFAVADGAGILSLPQRGRPDNGAAQTFEEADIAADVLRSGRFIHLLPDSGKRQSYAFSRVTSDKLAQLPTSEWISLESMTEFGFRYTVLSEVIQATNASLAIAVPTPPLGLKVKQALTAQPVSRATPPPVPERLMTPPPASPRIAAPRPRSVASASLTGSQPAVPGPLLESSISIAAPEPSVLEAQLPPAEPKSTLSDMAAPPTPIEAGLANAAINNLEHSELCTRLATEMGKVSMLHQHIERMERNLSKSRQREADLLELLMRWQSRED